MTARQTAVDTAISLKGQRNKVVDIYNTYTPRPRGYKVKYEDMLCATYVSAVFVQLGWTDIVPPECGAKQLHNNMAALGRGVINRKRTPDVGDLIFFGNGDTANYINHVGIVTEVQNGKQIYYYDLTGVVGRHTCPVGYSWIIGYGMPSYSAKDKEGSKEDPTPHEFKAGDLVTVNPGAKWYKGESIKLNVFSDKWYITQVKGDRAVLGMNLAETRNIVSPIHTSDITLVVQNDAVVEPEKKKVKLSIEVDTDTYELLKIMADGWKLSIGEVVDRLLEDAK